MDYAQHLDELEEALMEEVVEREELDFSGASDSGDR